MASFNRWSPLPRRSFVAGGVASSVAGLSASLASSLPRVSAQDLKVDSRMVRFNDDIEPLVRLIEETPRDSVIDKVMAEIHSGRSYKELLAAMFLAGIRNVQPRPAVGFKFHCVLVVYATHQASLAAEDHQRWLPLLWAIDNFKSSQTTDVREGNWTMASVDEGKLPPAEKSLSSLADALERWDVEAADAAAAAAARSASRAQLLDVLARYASRDFRSIGHKSIYVAAAFRTLEVIGWEHAEPIIRSLAYAILNHQGDENPSTKDYAVDRAGRENSQLVKQWTAPWQEGKRDSKATLDALEMLRTTEPAPAAAAALKLISGGVHPQSISDAIALASAELVMRQPGIVPLHAVTTTNAMHYLAATVSDESLRKLLLLQNTSFLAHFQEAAKSRGKLEERRIESLGEERSEPQENVSLREVFEVMGKDRSRAAMQLFRAAQTPEAALNIVREARHWIFLKGTDAHDYKFSSAALEDYRLVSPEWRPHYLAGCSYLFRTATDKPSGLAEKVLSHYSK